MSKISIIVPIFKSEKFIDNCLQTIVDQTYKNLEIILVDDGSPDNCPQLCDKWAKKDERIKIIHKVNGGVSSARNAGLSVATGEYIQFVDSDDFLELNACETLYNNLILKQADLSVANFKLVGYNGLTSIIDEFISDDIEKVFEVLYTNNLFSAVWNKLYKKSLITKVFDVDQKYSEDFIFNCEYMYNCSKVAYTNEIVYNYVYYKNSAVNKFNEKCFPDQCKTVNYIENVLEIKFPNLGVVVSNLKAELIISSFFSLIKSKEINYREKRKIISEYTKTRYFKKALKDISSKKRKIFAVLLKLKFIKLLEIYFKYKRGS